MMLGSPPVYLDLYCASQIMWTPCYNEDYDSANLWNDTT